MKFKANTRRRALEYEKDLVQQWKMNKTFEKSVEQRPKDNSYVFYDGPPFISGDPHHGTLLSSIVKDAIPRYQTMKGKRVERVWGWDCHGLPAERYTEKKLGIHSREEVLEYGIERYILACRANMVQTSGEWENVVDRIGRWVDFKGAYKTMDKEYMESVWWSFKTLYDKGKIFEGEKVLMYCTLDATPLSKAEVTMDAGAYQDVTDPSVYVKFKLNKAINEIDFAQVSLLLDANTEGNNAWRAEASRALNSHQDYPVYLLAWTTTPWTLPANTALAVNEDLSYSLVFVNDTFLVIATDLVEKVLIDDKKKTLDYVIVNNKIEGQRLVGLEYESLFEDRGENAHKIWAAEYVTTESGTGIVHLAPAYGEEDFELAKEKKIPVVHTIDENGVFTEGDWEGENVWEINKTIAKDLKERGVVWKIDYIRHSYPHCHRCGTKLMYRAHPSWFMDIVGQREQMLQQNGDINWFPHHLKKGRFAKNIEQAPDWNISRDRFWATAMPVWKSESGKVKVVGSYAELKELSGVELDDYHRPWIDEVTFKINGETYTRTDKVMDSWFEAASMPFAQFHYPFENKQKFEDNFPGDFIVEYIGQVRAWFYYMHAMSVALFGENSFKNVITTGTLAGNDGRKMSKNLGNYTDPNELMDQFSADSLRYVLLASPVLNGEDFSLKDKDVNDAARKLSMIWNMYDFFTMYAEVDGWEFKGDLSDPHDDCQNPLDQWIISRVHQLTKEVGDHMDRYDIPNAVKPILPFIDDASNWYVRRSRRRFWKSGDDNDKNNAYRTLHYVLVQLAQVMAPFTPFLAEELYQKLTGGESVHLLDWPTVGHLNELALDEMKDARGIINDILSLRAKNGIKIRQPLSRAEVKSAIDFSDDVKHIIQDEVNIKKIEYVVDESIRNDAQNTFIGVELNITPKLAREGLSREVIRHVQAARKQAGLNVDDHIALGLKTTDAELKKAISEHEATIQAETLTDTSGSTDSSDFETTVVVGEAELIVSITKVT